MNLTQDEVKMIVDALTEKVILLKGKNGTEFTQAQLTAIIKKLEG